MLSVRVYEIKDGQIACLIAGIIIMRGKYIVQFVQFGELFEQEHLAVEIVNSVVACIEYWMVVGFAADRLVEHKQLAALVHRSLD